ncbi:hypothetical protein P9112_007920 [Eukaryota sp. TZLM1-RC]
MQQRSSFPRNIFPSFPPHTVPDFGCFNSFKCSFPATEPPSFGSFKYGQQQWYPSTLPYRIVSPSSRLSWLWGQYTPRYASFTNYRRSINKRIIQAEVFSAKYLLEETYSKHLFPDVSSLITEDIEADFYETFPRQSFIHNSPSGTPLLFWVSGDRMDCFHTARLFSPVYPTSLPESARHRSIIPDISRAVGNAVCGPIYNIQATNLTGSIIGVSTACHYGISLSIVDSCCFDDVTATSSLVDSSNITLSRRHFAKDGSFTPSSRRREEVSSKFICDFSTNSIVIDVALSPVKGIFRTAGILDNGDVVIGEVAVDRMSNSTIKPSCDSIRSFSTNRSDSHRISWLGNPFQFLTVNRNLINHVDLRTAKSNLIYSSPSSSLSCMATPSHDQPTNPFLYFLGDSSFVYGFDLRFTAKSLFEHCHSLTSPPKFIENCGDLLLLGNDSQSLLYSFEQDLVPSSPPIIIPSFKRPHPSLVVDPNHKNLVVPQTSGWGLGEVDGKLVVSQGSSMGHVFLTVCSRDESISAINFDCPETKEHCILFEELSSIRNRSDLSINETLDFRSIREEIVKDITISKAIDDRIIKRVTDILTENTKAITNYLCKYPVTLFEYYFWFRSQFLCECDCQLLLKLTQTYIKNIKSWTIDEDLIKSSINVESIQPFIEIASTLLYSSASGLPPHHPSSLLITTSTDHWVEKRLEEGSLLEGEELEKRAKFIIKLMKLWRDPTLGDAKRTVAIATGNRVSNKAKPSGIAIKSWEKSSFPGNPTPLDLDDPPPQPQPQSQVESQSQPQVRREVKVESIEPEPRRERVASSVVNTPVKTPKKKKKRMKGF